MYIDLYIHRYNSIRGVYMHMHSYVFMQVCMLHYEGKGSMSTFNCNCAIYVDRYQHRVGMCMMYEF